MSASPTDHASKTARAAAEIARAAALLGADPAAAATVAAVVLRSSPHDPRAKLILASARRRLGDPAGALAILDPLARDYPKAAKTQFELGMARAALGDSDAAVGAWRASVALDRDQPDAWRALGEALFAGGDVAGAEVAFAETLRASLTDPALRAASDAIIAGRPGEAERLIRSRLARAPADAAALRLLGTALAKQDRHAEAEAALRDAIRRDPGYDGARFTLAEVLFQQQKGEEAARLMRDLLARRPADPAYRNLLAAALSLVGDPGEVEASYTALVADFPKQPKLWLNFGHALRTSGRFEKAEEAYRRAIALSPSLGDAYWSLANLKLARFSAEDVAGMEAQLARAELSREDRLHLHYALGKALEDREAYEDSFRNYAAGSAIRRADLDYDADQTTDLFQRTAARFTPDFFQARAGAGSPAADPIFIVGLPRSGSTLVEQILASHPQVEGTMELPDISLMVRDLALMTRIGERDHLDVITRLAPDDLRRLGERYLETTRVHRHEGRPLFTDKMPNNFPHAGLIHLILPKAKIIDVRRHPLSTAFAVFKQNFARGQSFSYDLTDIGRYYADYVRLMACFDDAKPGLVHRVIYEDLVDDLEGQVRALLDYCGLPFDAACLRFHETRRAVKTVSSEQVRRPIFRQGVDQWRNYAPWLGPAEAALGPVLENWRV